MSLHGRVFVVLAIVGYGREHDQAYAEYRQIEANNKLGHLRVVPLADAPNQGQYIADVMRGFLQADDLHNHDYRQYQQQQLQQQQPQQRLAPTMVSMPAQQPPLGLSFTVSNSSSSSSSGGPGGPPSYQSVFTT